MGGVGHNGVAGNVVRQNFVVGVEDGAALGVDGLFVDVLLSRTIRVLVVLDHLQVDEPERKEAEQPDESQADQRASVPAVPLHLAVRWFATGCTASSPRVPLGGLRRTMLCSAIGIILR